tara:strand:+ start:568 stop:963 length:396 start_codon:yes stop_codon:yes gene_type:complete
MDLSILSDLHKDARGFRPSGDYTKWFNALPLYAKAKEWDRLTEELKQREVDRGIVEAVSLEDFKKTISGVMKSLEIDRDTALRWLTQSTKFYTIQCVEHWVWKHGILFTDYGKKLVKEIDQLVEYVEVEND